MTDKQQSDALELASVAESADLAGYPTAKKANAYCLCLLEDCAQMIRRLHAENETLRAGYAAARLEIESLKSQLAEHASHGQAPAQAASSAVLKAIREANMQLVRTGDDAFMLVPYKAVTAQAAESVPAGPRRKDMLWATAKMQERHDQRIENIVSGLERIKQEHAGQQPQKIDECYGDCPTDSTTCTNPCRFDGRAARAKWGTQQPAHSGEPVAWKHDCAALLTNDVELWIDACPHCGKPRNAPQPVEREPLTPERVKEIVRGAGYDQCGIPDTERSAFINGLRHGEREHGIGETP